jgi:hypothetical protein
MIPSQVKRDVRLPGWTYGCLDAGDANRIRVASTAEASGGWACVRRPPAVLSCHHEAQNHHN